MPLLSTRRLQDFQSDWPLESAFLLQSSYHKNHYVVFTFVQEAVFCVGRRLLDVEDILIVVHRLYLTASFAFM